MATRKQKDNQIKVSNWIKPFKSGLEWEKDEILELIHWVRQILAIVIGFIWGLVPFKGVVGILSFISLNALISFLYYSKFLGIDDEEFGRFDLLQEGFVTSFALFMVIWTVTYNMVYFQ